MPKSPISTTHYKETEDGRSTTVVFLQGWDSTLPHKEDKKYNDLYRSIIFKHLCSLQTKKEGILEVLGSSLDTSYDFLTFMVRVKSKPDIHRINIPLAASSAKSTPKESKTEPRAMKPKEKTFSEMDISELPSFMRLGVIDGVEYVIDPVALDNVVANEVPLSFLYCDQTPITSIEPVAPISKNEKVVKKVSFSSLPPLHSSPRPESSIGFRKR